MSAAGGVARGQGPGLPPPQLGSPTIPTSEGNLAWLVCAHAGEPWEKGWCLLDWGFQPHGSLGLLIWNSHFARRGGGFAHGKRLGEGNSAVLHAPATWC